MIPIKIECGCGQRYAFDAEPVNGLLTAPVNCPACGTEGTATANEIIAQTMPPLEPVAAPSSGMRLQVSRTAATSVAAPAHHMPASAPHASQLGLVDRDQAVVEARAKVSWGDSSETVLKYLMIQGFTHEEASALINGMFKERAMEVRKRGIKKIFIGSGMIVAAGSGLAYLFSIKVLPLKLMGILFAICAWGLWIVINGAIMVALPKMQSGDVAEQ